MLLLDLTKLKKDASKDKAITFLLRWPDIAAWSQGPLDHMIRAFPVFSLLLVAIYQGLLVCWESGNEYNLDLSGVNKHRRLHVDVRPGSLRTVVSGTLVKWGPGPGLQEEAEMKVGCSNKDSQWLASCCGSSSHSIQTVPTSWTKKLGQLRQITTALGHASFQTKWSCRSYPINLF